MTLLLNSRKTISDLSSQFSAIKESVLHINRGGYIKKSSLPIPNPLPVPEPADPNLPTAAVSDDIIPQGLPLPEPEIPNLPEPPIPSIPDIPAIPDIPLPENPLPFRDSREMQEPFRTQEEDFAVLDKILLIENVLRESEILQLVENLKRTELEDTRYTAPPKTQQPDSPPTSFKFEASPVVESRTYIEGRYSAAEIASISKIANIPASASVSDVKAAYEHLVASSRNHLSAFFDALENVPTVNVAKRSEDAFSNSVDTVAINIDVIVTLDTNAAIIAKEDPSAQYSRSEARGCLSDHIQAGSLVLSGNGMNCQDNNEACKQCLYEIYQQAAQMRD